eukprot:TRINITY_DN6931_c0_g1_i1.p1 TRINITY_DN6931_c0_g1~~TRINITY_DN6931_c0_g1_i1.p1  ORF type:complete len:253 (+),score=74.62 TRINITY_DN6931_c0_g1_i1:86-844(+)
MSGTREENVFMARIAESAQRYEDMVEYIKRVAKMGEELSIEERNLLSVAFKNSVGARRKAWRNVYHEEKEISNEAVAGEIRQYRGKIEAELRQKCEDMLALISKELLPKATLSESKVFYIKMTGDYYRYVAEFSQNDDASKQQAHQAYTEASQIAAGPGGLPPAHVTRLGLALNHSVFHYEVLGQAPMACQLAREALMSAEGGLGELQEDERVESEQIMQLLRDNLSLWQSDMHAADGGRPPENDGTAVEEM